VTAEPGVAGEAVAVIIEGYRALLGRFHRTLDLMSERGWAELDAKLADAEAYAAAIGTLAGPGTVLDVGSGAGLPGVVIAAHAPERPVLWVERRRRRATFLTLVAAKCGLTNVEVVADDVRTLTRERLPRPLAAVSAQAVAKLPVVHAWTRHLHTDPILLLARRGTDWAEEVQALTERHGAAVPVLRHEPLGRGGTLVVLRVPGGPTCR
jgi:16S rRNA (guanine527-N7)-methyltransferase